MSVLPAVLDALVATLQDAPGLYRVQVVDGPVVDYLNSEGVAVGATRDFDPAVAWSRPPAGLEGQGEAFDVACLAWSGSGSTVVKPVRDRVDQILDAVDARLAEDRTIAGTVSTAWITAGSYVPEQTGSGAIVYAEFRITCTVF